jgi:peptidoglycan/LPS O-acetylase OafA/YrhL
VTPGTTPRGDAPAGRPRRLHALDGLRGVAALSVVAGHAIGLAPLTPAIRWLQASPLRILWNGGDAVILFFVLSGFVLSLPYVGRQQRLRAGEFILLRIARIYPAYWFALALSCACIGLFAPQGMTGLSEWANSFYRGGLAGISPSQMVRHILLVTRFDSHLVNPPSWTLMIEMRMSLLMPALIWLVQWRDNRLVMATLVAGSIAAANLVDALHYLPMFTIGVVLARYWDLILARLAGAPKPLSWMLVPVAIALYGNDNLTPGGAQPVIGEYATAAGAALLIALVSDLRALARPLETPPFQYVGRASYGIYLLHFPILFLFASRLYPVLHSVWLVALVAVPAACMLAHACFVWIERPIMRAARQGLGRLGRPAVAAPLGRHR